MTPLPKAPCEHSPNTSSDCLTHTLQEALAQGQHALVLSLLNRLRLQLSTPSGTRPNASNAASVAACVLRSSPAPNPQVGMEACLLLEEVLESCASCGEADGKGSCCEEAMQAVVDVLKKADGAGVVHSAATRVLLKYCGCSRCPSVPDRARQSRMGEMGAVKALIELITSLNDEQGQDLSGAIDQTVADGVHLLFFLCFENQRNLTTLLANKGIQTLQACVQADSCQKTAQEHGCLILAGLACCDFISEEESAECITAITTVGKLQLQGKCREAASAMVSSLTLVGSCACFGRQISCNLSSPNVSLAWTSKEDMIEHTMVEMMHSCDQKDNLLLLHCLQYMFVVGSRNEPRVDKQSVLSSALPFLYHHVLLSVQDIRVQGAALRAICALLRSPQNAAYDILIQGGLDKVLCVMGNACRSQEASTVDIFSLKVFGLRVLRRLLNCMDNLSLRTKPLPGQAVVVNQLLPHLLEIHSAVLYIAKHLSEASKTQNLNMYLINDEEQLERCVGRCYQSLHCGSFLQDPCKWEDLVSAVEASAVCLTMCGGGAVNVADSDGITILHGLAQLGHSNSLVAFISAGGHQIDFAKTTNLGLNALQLARVNKNVECLEILEKYMGASIRRRDIVLPLYESQSKDCAWKQHHAASNRNITKNKSNLDPSGETGDEANKLAHTGFCVDETENVGCRDNPEYMRAAREKWVHVTGQTQCMVLENQENKRGYIKPAATQDMPEGQNATAVAIRKLGDEVLWANTNSHEAAVASGCQFCEKSHLPCNEFCGHEFCHQQLLGPTCEGRICALNNKPLQDTQNSHFVIPPSSACTPKWTSTLSSLNKGPRQAANPRMPQETSGEGKMLETRSQPLWPGSTMEFPKPQNDGFDSQREQKMSTNAQCYLAGTRLEEHGDENHMLRWLSSEISGLIDNAHDEAGDFFATRNPHPFPPMVAAEYEGDLPRNFGLQTLQSFGYEQREWSKDNLAVMDTPCSPLHLDSVSANSSSIQYSSDQAYYPTPNQTAQAWFPQIVPSDDEFCSPSHGSPYVHCEGAAVQDVQFQAEEGKGPSKHLWLGNLNTRLPRSVLKSVFEQFGAVEDVVTFPGRMYAFVNYVHCEDAQKAAQELDMKEVPALTGSRKLVVKFRPNRKALGRVGDLMPGVNAPDHQHARSVPSNQAWNPMNGLEHSQPALPHPNQIPQMHESLRNHCIIWPGLPQDPCSVPLECCFRESLESCTQQSQPSKHLWIGNVCLRPSKTILFSLFSRYGPVESVRIFPGKTFAFVNFQQAEHAARTKECLDGEVVSAISGAKALVVRFQRDGSGPPSWFKVNERKVARGNDSPGLMCSSQMEGNCVPGSGRSEKQIASHDRWTEMPPVNPRFPGFVDNPKCPPFHDEVPGLNLANRLNPNNVHYDCQLALRYKKMGKGDKEALWANHQDRQGYMDESSSLDLDGPPSHRTATEADSIGRLTRTLSAAAAKGKTGADYPLRSISLGNSQPMFSFDEDLSLHNISDGLKPSFAEPQNAIGSISGNQCGIGMPKFSSQVCLDEHPGGRINLPFDISRTCANNITSHLSLREFQNTITGSLGQFEKMPQLYDPVSSGQANRSHIPLGSSSRLLGKPASLLHQNSRDTVFHTCLSLECDEASSTNRRIW